MTPRIIQDGHARHDPSRVLDELQRIALEQLGRVPGELYRPIEESLHLAAQRDTNFDAGRGDLAALLQMRQRSSTYVMRFRQMLGYGFDAFRGAVHARRNGPLGLVGEAELEDHIAAQRLAEAIAHRYARPLDMLDARFEALTTQLGSPAAPNPVGASRLAAAFVDTFIDAQLPPTLRPLLFRHYENELGKVLGDLYGRLNTQLAAAGYGPHRPQAVPKAAATGSASMQSASGSPSAARIGGEAPDTASQRIPGGSGEAGSGDGARTSTDLQRLRELLHHWRHGGLSGSMPVENAPQRRPAPRRELRVDEVLTIATLIQGDDPAPFAEALGGRGVTGLAGSIRRQLIDQGRRLGIDPDDTRFSAEGEDAIDLVALLFESLFESRALLQQAQRLYARLVLPYVKVALTDSDLFARREHPARRMLDALTEVCEGNDGSVPQERDMLERAARAVHRVIADYNEDLAVFELATAELQALLTQQRRRIETMERRSADAVHGRERLLQARLQAHAAVGQTLASAPVTAPTAEFLEQYWQQHLVQTLLRDGFGSPQHAEALALGEAILKVDAAAAAGRGRELADRVIALQSGIATCLGSSGLDDSAAQAWMLGMLRALITPDAPREMHVPSVADATEALDEAELRLVGGNAGLHYDPGMAARLRGLTPGSWLSLGGKGEPTVAAKVAWISPLTSRLLLVNRRGVRVLVASAEQLAVLAADGTLQLGGCMAPVDEAMHHVERKLASVSGLH